MLEGVTPSHHISGGISELYSEVMNETSFCASHCFSRESLAKETCDERGRVAAVSKVFDDVFQLPQCTFLKRTDYKEKILLYEGRIQNTVDRLGSYFKKAMEEKDFPTITPPEAMEEKDPPPAVTELIYFPGCTSQEVPGVQPVIATLLRAIGSCCHLSHDMEKKLPLENGLSKQDSAHQTSPPKIDVLKERIIAGSDVRKYRSCDFTIWVRRRFLVLMLDSSIELTIEVKPGQRIDKKPNALRHEARDQCLSHMSKSLLSCLRHGISHNDVNDRNILLRQLEDGQLQPVLVDYSIASKMYDTIEGFRGTPQFTHREIHKKSKWLPVPNFDWTSLGLTMVALIEKGLIPWSGFHGIESGNDEYERRIQEAKACLASAVETNKIGEKLKEEIEGLVVLDKESSNKCKKEKPDAAVDDLTFLDKKLTIPGTE
jgi:hypothetical protein